jgi:L-methionine (R)-S-oxide reductase
MAHDHGDDLTGLPAPLRPGDPPETKRHAYAALLDAARAVLSAGDGNSKNADIAAPGLDAVAAMSTLSFLLSRSLGHCSWAGFYRRAPGEGEQEETLIVGPYCGTSMGCLSISFSRGVCGTAARERMTQLVPDVSLFPGHIACSSSTRSEIVVPVFEGGDVGRGRVAAVLDLDSEAPAAFDEEDAGGLEALCAWLGRAFFPPGPCPRAAGSSGGQQGGGAGERLS